MKSCAGCPCSFRDASISLNDHPGLPGTAVASSQPDSRGRGPHSPVDQLTRRSAPLFRRPGSAGGRAR